MSSNSFGESHGVFPPCQKLEKEFFLKKKMKPEKSNFELEVRLKDLTIHSTVN